MWWSPLIPRKRKLLQTRNYLTKFRFSWMFLIVYSSFIPVLWLKFWAGYICYYKSYNLSNISCEVRCFTKYAKKKNPLDKDSMSLHSIDYPKYCDLDRVIFLHDCLFRQSSSKENTHTHRCRERIGFSHRFQYIFYPRAGIDQNQWFKRVVFILWFIFGF